MRAKRIFNEIYIGFIHLWLQFALPLLWIVFMDKGSLYTRILVPLTLFGYSLTFSKSVARLVFEEQSHA